MQLEIIKLNYDITNRECIKYFEKLIEKLEDVSKEEVSEKLKIGKAEFERLMEAANEGEGAEASGVYLKDVQYGIIDALFLFSDLQKFLEADLMDRFKLRVMNYIKKDRINRLL